MVRFIGHIYSNYHSQTNQYIGNFRVCLRSRYASLQGVVPVEAWIGSLAGGGAISFALAHALATLPGQG